MSTTRVSFYIVPEREVYPFLCRFTDKVYRMGHKVYIHTLPEHAHYVDELLWQLEPEHFVPHGLIDENLVPPPPVQIGFGAPHPHWNSDVLINLAPEVPNFFQKFQRIVEVVPQDNHIKTYTRNHYRFYHQQGLPIQSHDLTESEAPAAH